MKAVVSSLVSVAPCFAQLTTTVLAQPSSQCGSAATCQLAGFDTRLLGGFHRTVPGYGNVAAQPLMQTHASLLDHVRMSEFTLASLDADLPASASAGDSTTEVGAASSALADLLGATADLLRATAGAARRAADTTVSEGQVIESATEQGFSRVASSVSRLLDSAQGAARDAGSTIGDAAGSAISGVTSGLDASAWQLPKPEFEVELKVPFDIALPPLHVFEDVSAAISNASVWEAVSKISLPSQVTLPTNGTILAVSSSALSLVLAPVQQLWRALQFSTLAGSGEALFFYAAILVLLLALANQPRQ